MKKFFYFVFALALSTGNAMAFENEPEEGFSFMGLFGMNISKIKNIDYGAKAGAMLGIRADYVLPKAHGTYLTAGVDWTMKGGKSSLFVDAFDENEASTKYILHYIEIPIRVGFRYNISEEIGVYAELGPYFAVGVGGRHRCSIDADGADARTIEDGLSFNAFKNGNEFDPEQPSRFPFQRWDAGIGFRIGAEYNQHYYLLIGADWGLADMFRGGFRDGYANYFKNLTGQTPTLPKPRNFNFSITVGYRF